MEQKEIHDKLMAIIADVVGIEETEINSNSHFTNDLGCDSILLSELIMVIEDKFDIRIADVDAEKLKTVGDVMRYLEKL